MHLLAPINQPLNAETQLRQGNDTDKQITLIGCAKPCEYSVLGQRLHILGQHIRVQQKAQRSISRGSSLILSRFSSEFRSGEFMRNSWRVPLRPVLRSHSSADTTTTASLPCRVIFCGPAVFAFSMTSLRCALASATVHCPCVIGPPSLGHSGHSGHYSHHGHNCPVAEAGLGQYCCTARWQRPEFSNITAVTWGGSIPPYSGGRLDACSSC